MVYSTVRCYNKAGLPAQTSTDGVKLIIDSLSVQVPENSFTVLPAGVGCHTSLDTVRFRWQTPAGMMDMMNIKITLESPSDALQNSISSSLVFNHANLNKLTLQRNTEYTSSLVLGSGNEILSEDFITVGQPPSWEEPFEVTVIRLADDRKVRLSWEGAVTSSWPDLVYEVSLGTVQGGANVLNKRLTDSTYQELTLPASHNQDVNIYIVIVARDNCGSTAAHKEHIMFFNKK